MAIPLSVERSATPSRTELRGDTALSSWVATAAILVLGAVSATVFLVRPLFGENTPASVGYDFGNNLAVVAGALQTWRATGALPISSDQFVPGIEYPYFLFGNAAFYLFAAGISYILDLPASIGTVCALALGFVFGELGTYLLSRSFGVSRVYSAVIGVLYATGPYLCLDLLARTALPEFLAWQLVPLLCYLGRRAMRPGAGIAPLASLCVALSLPLYLHKLVGPHIMLFEAVLLLVAARPAVGWLARMVFLGVSVPALTIFAWLPTIQVSQDRIVTFNAGAVGAVEVFNTSVLNYLWPWAQDSLPAQLHASLPEYGDRFTLQIGLLASIGFIVGVWQLWRSRFKPLHRELIVAPIAVLVYSALALGVGGLVNGLPFPLNTIQFSLRLIGLAYFAGVLALIAGLADAPTRASWRAHVVPALATIAIGASTVTYWRPPEPINQTLASIGPSSLIDHSAFYPTSFKSLFDTSGAIGMDGALGARPWPLGLAAGVEHATSGAPDLLPTESLEQWPPRVFLLGSIPSAQIPSTGSSVVVRVYAVQTATSQPCASESELGKNLSDAISALVNLCAQRGVPSDQAVIGLAGAPRHASVLQSLTVTAPGAVRLEIAIPENVFFIAIECAPARAGDGTCLKVEYLGPPNQPDGTVQVPNAPPASTLTRGAFGQWTLHTAGLPRGDYLLPTFDYSFVRVLDERGQPVPSYQFDTRPVIRLDGADHTLNVGYDLRPELIVIGIWAGVALCLAAVGLLAPRSFK